ncbi:MAG: hypothetical protein ACRDUA_01135 [Micromonosporaceae bacterium]
MGDDDRRRPPGPDGLANVPEQAPRPVPSPWGQVIIPDDLSELDEEVAQVRDQIRQDKRRRRWHRLLGISDEPGQPGVMGPVLIVVLAVTVALASLIGSFWPYRSATDRASESPAHAIGQQVPEITLIATTGAEVRLDSIRPSVVLATNRCDCDDLIAEAAAVARQQNVTLVVVGEPTAPTLPPSVEGEDPDSVRSLGDPPGALREAVAPDRPTRDGTALALLVTAEGTLNQVLMDVQSAEEFASGVRRLR